MFVHKKEAERYVSLWVLKFPDSSKYIRLVRALKV
jgi:hypothetical protein